MKGDLSKFPSVLKKGFRENSISFPDGTEFKYSPLEAYRKITRKENDTNIVISGNDFKSYAELKKIPRGVDTNSASYYSCSFNISLEMLKVVLKLPRKNCYIIRGQIDDSLGPKFGPRQKGYIDLWLYSRTDLAQKFKVVQ